MRRSMTKRVFLLAAAFVAMAHGPARAQVVQDHLTCFKTRDPAKVQYALDLVAIKQPEFSQKGCVVAGTSIAFCVPSTKALRDPDKPKVDLPGSELEFDYVMFKIRCPRTPLPNKLVTDQLAGPRVVKFTAPISVLVPATKDDPPCGPVAGGQCGGECPSGTACTPTAATVASCSCVPPPKTCGRDAAGVCGGECPQGEFCETRLDAQGVANCACFARSTACGLVAGANQCGGECPQGQSCKTTVTTAGGVICNCTL